MNIQKIASYFIVFSGIILLLIFGQKLMIPFFLGLLLWFIMRKVKGNLNKIKFVKRFVPTWIVTVLSGLTVVIVLSVIINILTTNIAILSESYEKYQANVGVVVNNIDGVFNTDIMNSLKTSTGNINFGNILNTIFKSISSLVGSLLLILIYGLFIIAEESKFIFKIRKMFDTQESFYRYEQIIGKIDRSISRYFGLKTLMSLLTGVASYFVLLIIGVDAPVFWAFLIFILNYIPIIGSLIGTLFPTIFALLQFVEFGPAILVLALVGLVQLIVGNLIEPRVMGSSMNISPLLVILSLSFWSSIWGIIGMALSVPITVVMIIVLSQFDQTKKIAIFLSEKGNIETLGS